MNEKLKDIFSRRSIRKYQNKEISDSIINDLLEAAMSAPSARARDPWHFIVSRERDIIDEIADALPNGQMLKGAAAAIVVCGDINQTHDSQESFMLQDCSSAIENILIAVSALDMGACWVGVHPRQERISSIKKLFNLPDEIIPISCISIGWPDERKEARTRFNNVAVHWDKWQ